MKITEKVSFNIASEASYVIIWWPKELQKLMKNAKMEKFKWDLFGWFSNTVHRKTLLVDRSEFSILNIRPYCWCKDIPLRTSAWMSNAHVGWNTRSEKKVPGFSGSKFLISLMIGVLVPSMNFYQLVDIFAQSLLWN